MRSPSFWAVDCGASHVAVGRCRQLPDCEVALDGLESEPLPLALADEAGWAAAACAALQRLARRTRPRGMCIVGLPGHLTLHRTIRIPRVPARQRRQIVRFEIAQTVPCAVSEMQCSQLRHSADKDGEELVITAVRAATVATLCAGLRRAGFWPRMVLPAWLVWREGHSGQAPPTEVELVAAIGARTTQLVLSGGAGFFARTLALGGEMVSQGIAEHLHVSLDRAEALKLGFQEKRSDPTDGAPAGMAVQLATEQFARRLEGEILRSLAGLGPPGDAHRPTVLRLGGGGSLLADLPRLLAPRLSLRTERWPPSAAAPVGTAARDEWSRALADSHRTDLIILGRCGANARVAAANLLPRAARRAAFLRRWGMGMAAAAVVVLAAPLLVIRQARATAREDRRVTAGLDARIAAYRRLETRQRAAAASLVEINGRNLAVQRLAAARSSWVELAADLQDRLARIGDAWLERLQLAPPVSGDSTTRRSLPHEGKNGPPTQSPDPARRLCLTACLFDPGHPRDKPGDGAYRRAKALLEDLRASPFVAGVGEELFDSPQPGVLRFSVTLELAPGRPL